MRPRGGSRRDLEAGFGRRWERGGEGAELRAGRVRADKGQNYWRGKRVIRRTPRGLYRRLGFRSGPAGAGVTCGPADLSAVALPVLLTVAVIDRVGSGLVWFVA